ncbi:YcaO-like family protein [Parvimonas micra]|jgi:hypothetical protein|uniref:YcaO-like family protein n=1 Tax=Parvimonas micra TaxID=33033 RepID=UPI00123A9C6C|nr:YcaO-like family protein [Parvimonas micra]MCK6130993.1 YcaO-like family protein [Parvimonas micra]MCK6136658.1 YcaO-like family protein [Parvimonas micra]MCK6138112.1 YcaO-like family protein [Parvimonas micra]MCK6154640.1 YcaO-like family protein [Parvimonas micra]MCZ7409014.1 YcaO-like family protein [Parvimonas micra]
MKQLYKDLSPDKTMDILNLFFSNLELELKEIQTNSGNISYSHSLLLKNIGFFSNGKGCSEVYSKTSAIAELYERILNLSFIRFDSFSNDILKTQKKFFKLNYKTISKNIETFLKMENLNNISILKKKLISINILLEKLYNIKNNYFFEENNKIFERESFCIKFDGKKDLYLPVIISDIFLGSNGMSAGNTYEEAFVQSYSEILERYIIRIINSQKIDIDLVDKKTINKYSNVKNMINKLIKESNFEIKIFTFERLVKFPVICLLLIDKNKNRIAFKFGAHSSEEYAIERCITELLQGTELYDDINWKYIDDCINSENGESYKIFLNGKGLISNIGFRNLMNCKTTFYTKCSFKNNVEAYNYINSIEKEIYVFVASNTPLTAIQLYIPQKSIIHNIDMVYLKDLLNNIKQQFLLFRILYKLKENSKINSQIFYNHNKKNINKSVSDFIVTVCPIQNQYLSKIKILDIFLSIGLSNFQKENLDNRYFSFLSEFLKLGNITKEEKLKYLKTHKFINNTNNLSYCKKCKYYSTTKCILNCKKKLTKDLFKAY